MTTVLIGFIVGIVWGTLTTLYWVYAIEKEKRSR